MQGGDVDATDLEGSGARVITIGLDLGSAKTGIVAARDGRPVIATTIPKRVAINLIRYRFRPLRTRL